MGKVFWFAAGAVAMFLVMAGIGKRLEARGRGGRILKLVPRTTDPPATDGGCA
jgi:hypothetical protein